MISINVSVCSLVDLDWSLPSKTVEFGVNLYKDVSTISNIQTLRSIEVEL